MNAKLALLVLALVIGAVLPSVCSALPIEGFINVQPISVGPAADPVPGDPGIVDDLSFATRVFGQIGISVSSLRDDVLIMADDDDDGVWSRTEFLATLNNLGRGKPGNPVYLYYVPDYAEPGADGTFAETVSEEDVDGVTVMNPGIVLQASRRPDTLAHELGHMLTDEWRWKTPESSGGVHSNQANDLMALGSIRNIPTVLEDVYPMGTADEIRHTVGSLSGDPTAIIPQATAMYFQSSFVTTTFRDQIGVGIGIVDHIGGGPTVSAPAIDWGAETIISDVPHGTVWQVSEAARNVGTNVEQYALWFHSDVPRDTSTIVQFAITDIDSLGYNFINILDDTVMVQLYSDILTDAGKLTLTAGVDYVWSSVIDGIDGDLDQFGVTIINSAVFAGVHDFYLSFNAAMSLVPEPSTLVLAGIATIALLVFGSRRRAMIRTVPG